jgi:hypothetical protein
LEFVETPFNVDRGKGLLGNESYAVSPQIGSVLWGFGWFGAFGGV